jgi:ABC-type multidrug transport system permease subunit
MNWKRLWLTALVVFIAGLITNFIIHWVILGGYYSRPDVAAAFRPLAQMNSYWWVMFITWAVFSFFFTFIFAKGYEGRGLGEGIRYGIIITFFYYYVAAFDQFVSYPIPYALVWIWIVAGIIQALIFGILAALTYKPKGAPAAA